MKKRLKYVPATALLGLLIFYLVIPFFRVFMGTHPVRIPLGNTSPADRGLSYQNVTFQAADGILLSGWYIPSQTGAAIILTHGYDSNRTGLLEIAEPLAKCGFGILMYDTRDQGLSQAAISTRGWTEVNDVLGAVSYLQSRPDVDTARIGAFGSSMGGQITIRAAAQAKVIKAIVTDGASTAVFDDEPTPSRLYDWINYPAAWVFYKELALSTGQLEPPGVVATIASIAPRPILMISSGQGHEQQQMRKFYGAAGQPKSLWEIPDADHVQGIYVHPEEYENRVVDFFTQALLKDSFCKPGELNRATRCGDAPFCGE